MSLATLIRVTIVGTALASQIVPALAEPEATSAATAPAPVDAAPSSVETKAPYEIVRTLHALQDQMALGSTAAQAALPALAARIAENLLAADPDSWRDPRNARAAVSYILSGGQPRVVRKILDGDRISGSDRKLLEGAAAYVDGRETKARQLLLDIDAKTFTGALGGHLALAQAVLVMKENPTRALRFLDAARLLAPGSLVEEAALRRGIALASEAGAFDRFVSLSGQYLRRFATSVYAQSFRRQFGQAAVHFALASNPAQIDALDKLIAGLKPEDRDRLRLAIVQAALISGKVAVARSVLDRTIASLPTSGVEADQAMLYDGATELFAGQYETGRRKVESVPESRLAPRDRDLQRAVRTLAERMHGWPEIKGAPSPETAAAAGRPTAVALIADAERLLTRTDDLLKTTSP